MSLHLASRILCSGSLSRDHIEYAHSLLLYFVKSFTVLYDKENNIHNLHHISEDVSNIGKVDSFSAFPFENYMQSLKWHIRKSEKSISLIIRRIAEEENFLKNISTDLDIHLKEHNSRPIIKNCCDPQFQE